MTQLKWNEGMSVGVDSIDNDHKTLLSLINELSDAINANEADSIIDNIFLRLENYIKQHFSREELMLEQCRYNDLDEHRQQHQKFIDKIPELRSHLQTADNLEVAQEVSLFLTDWLMNHIVVDDMSYAKTLYDNGFSTAKEQSPTLFERILVRIERSLSLNKRILLGMLVPVVWLALMSAVIFLDYYQHYSNLHSQLNAIGQISGDEAHGHRLQSIADSRAELERFERKFIILAVVLVVSVASSIVVSWLLGSSIVSPIRRLTGAMKRMSDGYRDVRFNDDLTNDEIGEMFHAYEYTRRKLLQVDILSGVNFQRQSVSIEQKEREKEAYLLLASTDALTGAVNRRKFIEYAELEFKRAKRYRHGLSLMMLDIDHFKKINDTYGHAGGDSVLKAFYECCHRSVRETDIVARIGGEEFSILMPETSLDDAIELAQRTCKEVSSLELEIEGKAVRITVSIGVCEWSASVNNIDNLMEIADKALYQAKEKGRNRVVSA